MKRSLAALLLCLAWNVSAQLPSPDPDGSLIVGDSQKGRVWRIFYVGEKK